MIEGLGVKAGHLLHFRVALEDQPSAMHHAWLNRRRFLTSGLPSLVDCSWVAFILSLLNGDVFTSLKYGNARVQSFFLVFNLCTCSTSILNSRSLNFLSLHLGSLSMHLRANAFEFGEVRVTSCFVRTLVVLLRRGIAEHLVGVYQIICQRILRLVFLLLQFFVFMKLQGHLVAFVL